MSVEELSLLDLLDESAQSTETNLWEAPGSSGSKPRDVSVAPTDEPEDELAELEIDDSLEDSELQLLDAQAQLFDTSELVVERSAEQLPLVYSVEQLIDESFEHFRRVGFPLRKLERYQSMQVINELAQTSSESLLQSTLGYSVADTYHPHRLSVQIAKRPTPIMQFHHDRYFRHALKLCYEQTGAITESRLLSVLALVRGAQAAANFRPGFALLMYRRFTKPGDTVLDTSTGFGGRLVGFLASHCKRYIGIDPATLTHEANARLAAELKRPEQDVTLVNMPAEDVAALVERGIPVPDKLEWSRYGELFTELCDFAFTSPPYFSKEHYSDEETQSWKRYSTGESWRVGFLEPMMRLQFAMLKKGASSCVNIAAVTINNIEYPLDDWTRDAGIAAGFHFSGTERFPMPRGFGQGVKKETFEPMLVFKK